MVPADRRRRGSCNKDHPKERGLIKGEVGLPASSKKRFFSSTFTLKGERKIKSRKKSAQLKRKLKRRKNRQKRSEEASGTRRSSRLLVV